MARQAFFSLVATIRNQSHVLDANSWASWRYSRIFTTQNHYADMLEEQTSATNWSEPTHNTRNLHEIDIELFFVWCQCIGDTTAALARLPARVRRIYMFVPTFWPMTQHCTSALLDKHTLRAIGLRARPSFEPPRTMREVQWYWKATLIGFKDSPAYNANITIIIAPLENTPTYISSAVEKQRAYNRALVNNFIEHDGIFHKSDKWSIYDFGTLTATMGFQTASPTATMHHGKRDGTKTRQTHKVSFTNWHYACSTSNRLPSGATAGIAHSKKGPLTRRLPITVTARHNGGCSDYANAQLWSHLF